MAFLLSLWVEDTKSKEHVRLAAREDSTDDPVTALANCRMFHDEVYPILRANLPAFKRVKHDDIWRRIDRIEVQLPLGPPVLNGRGNHYVSRGSLT